MYKRINILFIFYDSQGDSSESLFNASGIGEINDGCYGGLGSRAVVACLSQKNLTATGFDGFPFPEEYECVGYYGTCFIINNVWVKRMYLYIFVFVVNVKFIFALKLFQVVLVTFGLVIMLHFLIMQLLLHLLLGQGLLQLCYYYCSLFYCS